MIVISGALVLVALVLLVIGLVSTSLPFVYASIAVSVVSFVFLIIGILQRRGEQLPDSVPAGDAAAPAEADGGDREAVTAVVRSDRRSAESAAAGVEAPADVAVSGSVLVVAGRPRYHVEGCRYLNGKDPDQVPVGDARDEGFTACGVCKPDEVLAQEAAAQPHPQPDEPVADVSGEPEDVPEAVVPAPSTRKRTKAPAKAPAKRPAAAATKAPARKAAAKAAPAKAPSKAAVAAAASTPAAASAAKRPGSVVVIPDRGKFHTPVCRFVRDSADAQELTRAQASRQGYAACGVCKP